LVICCRSLLLPGVGEDLSLLIIAVAGILGIALLPSRGVAFTFRFS
jgi:hypothetical protein